MTTAYVVTVVLVATIIRSTIGFGEALVAVPLLALRIPVAVAAPLAVSLSLVIAAAIVVQDWRHVDVRSASWLVGASLFGIPLGLLLLTRVDDGLVRLALGLVIAGFATYSLTARARLRLATDHRGWMLVAGFVSGILGGAYGMNGPPLAVYGALRGWSPQRFRATLQGYFALASLAGLLGYVALGLWRSDTTRYLVASLPSVAGGVLIGRPLNRRLRSDAFLTVVYAGLIAIGLVLIGQAISGRLSGQ